MKILSTPSKILFIAGIFALIDHQEVSAQMESIKSKQDEAAVLYRCFAEFTACPERKEYMIKMADYTECIGRQLNPANASTNCDRYRPKTDTPPNCPEDAARPEEATAFINNCTKSKGYNTPYNAGSGQSNAGNSSNNAVSGSNDQYQAAGQALATIFDAIREDREAKRQLRESRRTGTQANKNNLLKEAADLREEASGKFLPFILTAAGGYGVYSFINQTEARNAKNEDMEVGSTIIGIACGVAVLAFGGNLISKIAKGAKAHKLERQAYEMKVSFKPLIMYQQNGIVYNGISLKLKF